MDAASWNKSNGNNVEVTRYTSNFESKVVGASGELGKDGTSRVRLLLSKW